MKEVLAPFAPDNLVFLPTPVHTTWNRKQAPCFMVHLLHDVDFVDLKASDYQPCFNGEGILKVRKLALDKQNIGERKVFRTRELPMRIFVAETVKSAIEETGLTGVKFVPSEDFKKRHLSLRRGALISCKGFNQSLLVLTFVEAWQGFDTGGFSDEIMAQLNRSARP